LQLGSSLFLFDRNFWVDRINLTMSLSTKPKDFSGINH